MVKNYKLVVVLIDKCNNPSYISNELYNLGIRGTLYIGYNLSYEDEKIIKVKIGQDVEAYSSLGVVIVENEMD